MDGVYLKRIVVSIRVLPDETRRLDATTPSIADPFAGRAATRRQWLVRRGAGRLSYDGLDKQSGGECDFGPVCFYFAAVFRLVFSRLSTEPPGSPRRPQQRRSLSVRSDADDRNIKSPRSVLSLLATGLIEPRLRSALCLSSCLVQVDWRTLHRPLWLLHNNVRCFPRTRALRRCRCCERLGWCRGHPRFVDP